MVLAGQDYKGKKSAGENEQGCRQEVCSYVEV